METFPQVTQIYIAPVEVTAYPVLMTSENKLPGAESFKTAEGLWSKIVVTWIVVIVILHHSLCWAGDTLEFAAPSNTVFSSSWS